MTCRQLLRFHRRPHTRHASLKRPNDIARLVANFMEPSHAYKRLAKALRIAHSLALNGLLSKYNPLLKSTHIIVVYLYQQHEVVVFVARVPIPFDAHSIPIVQHAHGAFRYYLKAKEHALGREHHLIHANPVFSH